MSNHEIISQALGIMRETLSGYVYSNCRASRNTESMTHGGSRASCHISAIPAIMSVSPVWQTMLIVRMRWMCPTA